MTRTKLLSLTAALIIVMASFSSAAADRLLAPFTRLDGVTTVFVGKPLLKMASNYSNIAGTSDIDLNALMSKLTSLEVAACDGSDCAKEMNDTLAGFIKSHPDMELMMDVSENGDKNGDRNVAIYTIPRDGTDRISTLLIAVAGEEPTVVAINGDFTMDDLMAALGSMNSSASDK